METVAKVPLLRPVEAELEEKIRNRSAKAAVIGLGHVGLPLAAELIRAGYHVTAIDRDPDKIRRLRQGDSYIGDVSSATLAGFLKAERIAPLTDDAALADCDVHKNLMKFRVWQNFALLSFCSSRHWSKVGYDFFDPYLERLWFRSCTPLVS